MTTHPITAPIRPEATSGSRVRGFQIAWGLALCFYFLEYASQVRPGCHDPAPVAGLRRDCGRRQCDSRNLLLHLLGYQPDRWCSAGSGRRKKSCADRHFHSGGRLSAL